MTTRSMGPEAGFNWLMNGIRTGFSHPKPLFGGAAFLVVIALLPSMITLPVQFYEMRVGAPPSATVSIVLMLASMLFGLLIIPLYAGFLQMIDAAERGQQARALDIFKPYRTGEALRLIGLGLASLAIYIVGAAIIILATGRGIVRWYMQTLAMQAAHQLPPALPDGFWAAVALLTVFWLWLTGYYAISLGQVALNKRSVFGAIADGAVGALKNALPLFVFALSAVIATIAVIVVFIIVAMLLALIAKLVSPWLMLVLLVPLYIALLLLMFTTMFGVTYHLWREVCGGGTAVAMPPPLAA